MKQLYSFTLVVFLLVVPFNAQAQTVSEAEVIEVLRAQLIELIRELQQQIAELQELRDELEDKDDEGRDDDVVDIRNDQGHTHYHSDSELSNYEPRDGRLWIGIDSEGVEGIYEIDNGRPLSFYGGDMIDDHEVYWNLLEDIVPDWYIRSHLREFIVYDDPDSDVLAYVQLVYSDGADAWRMAINRAMSDGDLNTVAEYDTIVHEFGHIVSMNDVEVDFDESVTGCDTYFINSGCLEDDSFLYRFMEEFWQGEVFDDWSSFSFDDEDAQEEFYLEYQDHFVSYYASTDPVEDWAETFMYFILFEEPTSTRTVSDKKLQFFLDDPELDRIREHIHREIF